MYGSSYRPYNEDHTTSIIFLLVLGIVFGCLIRLACNRCCGNTEDLTPTPQKPSRSYRDERIDRWKKESMGIVEKNNSSMVVSIYLTPENPDGDVQKANKLLVPIMMEKFSKERNKIEQV